MTKANEAKMVKAYREFLKTNPMVYTPSTTLKGYMTITEAEMQKKDAEFLKHIGYEGDSTDFYWEHGIHLLTIRLKAMEK